MLLIKPSLRMTFQPELWDQFTSRANCYSYALNAPELGKQNLGGLTGEIDDWLSEKTVRDISFAFNHAVKDGLIPVNDEEQLDPDINHIIAVFVGVCSWRWSIYDFHFFRLDEDRNWSHKPGATAIQKINCNGKAECRELLQHIYSQNKVLSNFVGYFKIPETGLKAAPR